MRKLDYSVFFIVVLVYCGNRYRRVELNAFFTSEQRKLANKVALMEQKKRIALIAHDQTLTWHIRDFVVVHFNSALRRLRARMFRVF